MYKQFCLSFYNYLSLNKENLYNNEYRLEMLEPLYGLVNMETYENWKVSSDIRYYELSNIIYYIKQNTSIYSEFDRFYYELYGYGYDAIKSSYFDKTKVLDQIYFINFLLGLTYSKKES